MSLGNEDRTVEEAAERAALLIQVDQLREQEPRILNGIDKITEQLESTIQHTSVTAADIASDSESPSDDSPSK